MTGGHTHTPHLSSPALLQSSLNDGISQFLVILLTYCSKPFSICFTHWMINLNRFYVFALRNQITAHNSQRAGLCGSYCNSVPLVWVSIFRLKTQSNCFCKASRIVALNCCCVYIFYGGFKTTRVLLLNYLSLRFHTPSLYHMVIHPSRCISKLDFL